MPKDTKNRSVAEELCITDAKGRVRASLSFEPHGFPLLQLNDAAGRPRLELSLDPAGDPHLSMWSDKDECVLGIGFSSRERNSGMTLWAGNGGAILTIGVDQEGTYERLHAADTNMSRSPNRKGRLSKKPLKRN